MTKQNTLMAVTFVCMLFLTSGINANEILNRVEHGFIDNNGVKIHYVTLGQGPLIVMLHGFPDFWYTWRNQMEALSARY